ncbi:type IV pilus modification PilV family protein [Patulibacter defluvii]|uniref:type IV pilus modification PilV family protein n=1 Tax=Patulibacter defluvii TaxID=3095358 RepID=UPI002A75CDFE|nr:hypothetical protein [Patulibacter sp. DM4]
MPHVQLPPADPAPSDARRPADPDRRRPRSRSGERRLVRLHRRPRVQRRRAGARGLRSEGGFTMVEVLVAATILVAGVFATLALMDRGAAATSSSLQRDRGNAIAREVVERATGMRYVRTRDATTNKYSDVNELAGLSNATSTVRPELEVATRLRAALDPDGDGSSSAITMQDVSGRYVQRSSWQLTRAGTRYTITYRACTRSDEINQTIIQGVLDCDRPAVTTPPGTSFPPDTGSTAKCSLGLALGNNLPNVPTPTQDVRVRLQLLNVLGLDLCTGGLLNSLKGLTGALGLDSAIQTVCGALGAVGPTVGSVLSGVTGLLGTLGANANIGLCPTDEIKDQTLDIAGGIGTATKVETTVTWTDRSSRQPRTIRQTAVVRRSASAS